MKEKEYEMLRRAETVAWARSKVKVIIPPKFDGKYGVIKVSLPKDGMGHLRVFVWDTHGTGLQIGSARGCGYDKLSSALRGIVFDGIKFLDHCESKNKEIGNWEVQLKSRGYQIINAL